MNNENCTYTRIYFSDAPRNIPGNITQVSSFRLSGAIKTSAGGEKYSKVNQILTGPNLYFTRVEIIRIIYPNYPISNKTAMDTLAAASASNNPQ